MRICRPCNPSRSKPTCRCSGSATRPSLKSSASCVALRSRNSKSHAQRLELSPVPFEGWVLRPVGESTVLACGQTAMEADMVGLYDVFTAGQARNQGWARKLCAELLHRAVEKGARTGYLQVDASNLPARAVYQRLGFGDGYAYHYRTQPSRSTEPASPRGSQATQAKPFIEAEVHVHRLHGRTARALAKVVKPSHQDGLVAAAQRRRARTDWCRCRLARRSSPRRAPTHRQTA